MQVCVWLGANQQVRAATATLRAPELLERPEGPLKGSVSLQAALSTGMILTGMIGQQQRMPLFYGAAQVIAFFRARVGFSLSAV